MSKNITQLFFMTVVVLLAAGAILIVTWDIPAPVSKVTKIISNDRFPK